MATVDPNQVREILRKSFAPRITEQLARSARAARVFAGPPPAPAPPPSRWARLRTWLHARRQDVGFWIAGRDPRVEDACRELGY